MEFINEPFDEEERALMEAVENGHTKPLPEEEEREIRERIAASAARNITIRMRNEDVQAAKEKAARVGLPYQTLLNTIIHRYFNGGVILKEPV